MMVVNNFVLPLICEDIACSLACVKSAVCQRCCKYCSLVRAATTATRFCVDLLVQPKVGHLITHHLA